MKKIKMVALDTVHVTAVRAEPLLRDDEFEIDEGQAADLETRGLAKPVKAKVAKA